MLNETIGRSRVVRKIGEGGMGQVYLVDDPQLDRQVAPAPVPERAPGRHGAGSAHYRAYVSDEHRR